MLCALAAMTLAPTPAVARTILSWRCDLSRLDKKTNHHQSGNVRTKHRYLNVSNLSMQYVMFILGYVHVHCTGGASVCRKIYRIWQAGTTRVHSITSRVTSCTIARSCTQKFIIFLKSF